MLPTRTELFLRAIAKGSRFQSRFSLHWEDLMEMMRSGKRRTKSLGSTVSSAWKGGNSGLISTDKLKISEDYLLSH